MKRLLALTLSLCLLSGCGQTTEPAAALPQPSASASQPQIGSETEPEPEPEPEPVVAHLMVAGDVMSHMPITQDAYVSSTGAYDYSHMLTAPAAQLSQGDYAVANLETVLGGGPNYSGYPAFNSPDALAYDVKAAGFDLLSTANNHTRDKGVSGIFRTLDVLDEAGLAHVGTYRSQEERDEASGIMVADVGGISVAFLSYTYGLNGYQLSAEYSYAVNLFNLDYYTTLKEPDYNRLESDLAAAREMGTDLIAVMIHWGVEYQNAPNSYQTELAEFLVAQGADLVLGGHPHVLQPYETITATGWDGQERQGFVCYSLGNFLSNQLDETTKTTAVLDLELTRDPASGDTAVTDVSYTPYYMLHLDDRPAGQRRYLLNIHQAMADYEAGNRELVDAAAYGQLENALAHCHNILGAEGDRG
jgi:poly-gamma-glutamate synthesis protein (capsule biosynthesis protein)